MLKAQYVAVAKNYLPIGGRICLTLNILNEYNICMNPIGKVGIEQVVIEAYSEAARRELRRLGKPSAMNPLPIPPISAEAWWDEYHPKRRKL